MTGNTCNPKFRTPPIFASPSHDIMAWRESDFVSSHSAVNVRPRRLLNYDPPQTWPTLLRETTPKAPPPDAFRTQVLSEPGIYMTTHAIQPVVANIGISETPQFPPQELVVGDGYLEIRDLDAQAPNFVNQKASNYRASKGVNQQPPNYRYQKPILKTGASKTGASKRVQFSGPETVRDTRYEGPGDSRMMTFNELQGKWEPSGYREAVDRVRAPVPLVRSKLDMFDWARSIGTTPDDSLEKTHQLAVKQFFDDTDLHRLAIQNHTMRRMNEVRLQRRQLPIRTF